MEFKKSLIFILTVMLAFFNSCSRSDKPTIHGYLLPAYASMQSLVYDFNNQNAKYKDSVLLGDPLLIELSKEISHKITLKLQTILNQKDLPSNYMGAALLRNNKLAVIFNN